MVGNFYRISSSTTLFFKLFFPTFWTVFFGSFLIMILFLGDKLGYAFTHWEVKLAYLVVFGGFFLLMSQTIMKLKRIEFTTEAFFVTNYFRTYRYTYDSLSSIRETNLLLLKILTFRFTTRSAFGKKVFCIKRTAVWNQFIDEHPEVLVGIDIRG